MDRYNEENTTNKMSRSNRNQDLYENIGKNTRYTNFTDMANVNTYEINQDEEKNTRENRRKYKDLSSIIPQPKEKRELDEFKNIYKQKENRVYDINSVIAEARKNRTGQEEIESKRKLKNDKYNILLSMTKEELEEYRKERKEKYTHPDEEELHELIDTIASKTLAGEIDKVTSVNLLSELMATSIMDKVENPNAGNTTETDLKITTPVKMNYDDNMHVAEEEKEVENDTSEEDISNEKENVDNNQDNSFITNKKIDPEKLEKLNQEIDENTQKTDRIDKNLNTGNEFEGEMDEEFKEKKLPIVVKILIVIIVIAVIAAAAFYIYKYII